ncbi:hypothetical protein HHE02_00880, partial [Helicobacter heilmannii]
MKILKSCSFVLSGCLLASFLGGCGEALQSLLNTETPQEHMQKTMQQMRQKQEAEAKKREAEAQKARE